MKQNKIDNQSQISIRTSAVIIAVVLLAVSCGKSEASEGVQIGMSTGISQTTDSAIQAVPATATTASATTTSTLPMLPDNRCDTDEGRHYLDTVRSKNFGGAEYNTRTNSWHSLNLDKFPQLKLYLRNVDERYWFCIGQIWYGSSSTNGIIRSSVSGTTDVFVCMDRHGWAEATGNFNYGDFYLNVERIAFSCIDSLLEG